MAEIAQEKDAELAAIEVLCGRPLTGNVDLYLRCRLPSAGQRRGIGPPTMQYSAMNLHLAETAQAVAPGDHAVLLVDQAGWHLSHRLVIPPNITIVPLPPKCPELNPVENICEP